MTDENNTISLDKEMLQIYTQHFQRMGVEQEKILQLAEIMTKQEMNLLPAPLEGEELDLLRSIYPDWVNRGMPYDHQP